MKKVFTIEGIGRFSNGSFSFDSGLPSDEQVVKAMTLKGSLDIKENACADFRPDRICVAVPPIIVPVADEKDYKVKRSSRNYIVQIKVPVMENRAETQQRLEEMITRIVGDITLDRKELFEVLAA